jgi:hypothetical protein
LFADFCIYSKHNPPRCTAVSIPDSIDFLGLRLSKCRKRRHWTWQGPNAAIAEPGFGRNDLAGDPARHNTSIWLSIEAFLTPHRCGDAAESCRWHPCGLVIEVS